MSRSRLHSLIWPAAFAPREWLVGIAESECARRGWPFSKPVTVSRGWRCCHVMTNAEMRGGNANVWIDAVSGEVRRAALAER